MRIAREVGPSSKVSIEISTAPIHRYPAKAHARRVAKSLPTSSGLVLLWGTPTTIYEDSDQPRPFRQRRYFLYLSGVSDIPGCAVVYNIADDVLNLYIPPLDPSKVLWSGMPRSPEQCMRKYDVDAVYYTTDLDYALEEFRSTYPEDVVYIHPNQGQGLPSDTPVDENALLPAMDNARVIKDAYEIAQIRRANAISAAAHTAVVKATSPSKNEAELEGVFLLHSVARQAKKQAYDPIVGSGRNAATLHYIKNNEELRGRQLLLVDAGAEWEGYASDVTRTFPINGRWSKEAREVYLLVEKMQEACIKRTVSGVHWRETHYLAHQIAIQGLLDMGILKGDADEIFRAGTSRAFFPHGLGHSLGLECHDVEGAPDAAQTHSHEAYALRKVYADTSPPFTSDFTYPHPSREVFNINLKSYFHTEHMARIFQPGMVVTVEPGIYFCAFIIRPFLKDPVHSKYIDAAVLDKYWDVGGVRIEDDILVTKDGNENLTTAPKGLGVGAMVGSGCY